MVPKMKDKNIIIEIIFSSRFNARTNEVNINEYIDAFENL